MIKLAILTVALFLVGCGQATEQPRRQPPPSVTGGAGSGQVADTSLAPAIQRPNRSCPEAQTTEAPINLVVIAGNRANTYFMPENSHAEAAFCQLVGQTFAINGLEAEGNIAFVISDGNPWQADIMGANNRPADLQVSANNDYVLNNRITGIISNVILPFKDSEHAEARYEEADLLEALHVAERILRDMDPTRENHLLIIDSGITTTGHLDMNQFTVTDTGVAEEVANRLEGAGLLPDLSGVNLSFFNIGSGAAPQQVPTGPVEEALVHFWTTLLGRTGASLQIQGRSVGSHVRTGLPQVTPVNFEAPVVDLSDLRSEIFSEETLGFVAGESDFINEAASIEALAQTAAQLSGFLASNPTNHVYIVGSQAQGPDRHLGSALSQRRAQRVRDLLVSEFNLPSGQVVAIGGGVTEFSWRHTDEFLNGVWADDLAAQNRVVALIPSSAAEMEELRSHGFVD